MSALGWLYAAALIVAALVLLRRGWLRVFPLFLVYIAAGAAFMLSQPNIAGWAEAKWIDWQRVLLVLRLGCCAEILYRQTAAMERLRYAAMGVSVLLPLAALTLAWHIQPDSAVYMLAQVMRHVEAAIMVAVVLGLVVTWWMDAPAPAMVRTHSLLFAALMANQVIGLTLRAESREHWDAIMAASYIVGIACFACWIRYGVDSSAAQSYRPAPHSRA